MPTESSSLCLTVGCSPERAANVATVSQLLLQQLLVVADQRLALVVGAAEMANEWISNLYEQFPEQGSGESTVYVTSSNYQSATDSGLGSWQQSLIHELLA